MTTKPELDRGEGDIVLEGTVAEKTSSTGETGMAESDSRFSAVALLLLRRRLALRPLCTAALLFRPLRLHGAPGLLPLLNARLMGMEECRERPATVV